MTHTLGQVRKMAERGLGVGDIALQVIGNTKPESLDRVKRLLKKHGIWQGAYLRETKKEPRF